MNVLIRTKRNLLKQQYENFTASSSKVLDQTFDRLQKCISQLEIHGESISQDVNQKFLKSLVAEAMLTMRQGYSCKNTEENAYCELGTENHLGFDKYKSDQAKDGPTNFVLMAYSFTSSNSETASVDSAKKSLGYMLSPPPYTGKLYLLTKPNLSFSGLKEFVNEPIVSESAVKKPVVETSKAKGSADKPKAVKKNNGALIIEDWVSDSEEEDMP
ncbi:hypothetical protein Tco_1284438 [Tanacetum coccineum]